MESYSRILCRQCQFQWCWMCRQNWSVHGYSACNAFKEKAITLSLDAQTQAQMNLEKWLFYYDRYTNHELSAKLDQELYEQTEGKMVEVQNSSGLSWIQARYDFSANRHNFPHRHHILTVYLSYLSQIYERCSR